MEMPKVDASLQRVITNDITYVFDEMEKTNKERTAIYHYNHYSFGNVMNALFPNGILIDSAHLWAIFGIIVMIVSKIGRFATLLQTKKQFHKDSLIDISVYSVMLNEMCSRIENMSNDLEAELRKEKEDER